jgi:hypothetical protein
MEWKDGVIIALIFFGIGFIVGWHPALADVKNFIISGLSFGLVIELVGFLRGLLRERNEKSERDHDKERIYDWIYHKTEEYKGKKIECYTGSRFNKLTDPRFRSTEEIANALNMYPLEKVKGLCYINDRLIKMTQEDLSMENEKILDEGLLEKWAIKEFMR